MNRNFSGKRFGPCISPEERADVERIVAQCLFALSNSSDKHKGSYYPLKGSETYVPMSGGMNADEFASIVKKQIKAGEHFIVSHAYNMVHVEKRHEEIKKAYSTYAPRYAGDDEYDVGKLIADHKLRRKKKP